MQEVPSAIRAARFVGLDGIRKSSIDLAISYCGIQQCSPLHNNGPEIRDTSFVHIVKSGKGVLMMEGKVFHLKAGHAFLIPAGISAQYTADQCEPWTYMWVGFSGLMSEECMTRSGLSVRNPIRVVHDIDSLEHDIEGMVETYHLTFTNELRRNGYFFHFIAHLIDDYQAQGKVGNESSLQGAYFARKAFEYIKANFSNQLKIGELAHELGISRTYLYTCFKELYKVSPKNFLNTVRMEHAASLLIAKYLNIGQVAHYVGFEDELAFSKAFKEFYQLSPSEYRKLLCKTTCPINQEDW
jgi:AraC-like DNA-binding protein